MPHRFLYENKKYKKLYVGSMLIYKVESESLYF